MRPGSIFDTGDPVTRRMDWLVYQMRWLLLASAGVALFIGAGPGRPGGAAIALILIVGLYNAGLTILYFTEYTHPILKWGTLVMDSVLALSLFLASGGSAGPLIWIGLLPAGTVALRRSWLEALTVIAIFNLLQAGLVIIDAPSRVSVVAPLAIAAVFLWPMTIGTAYIAGILRGLIQAGVQKVQRAEQEQMDTLRAHARAIYEMSAMVSATLDYDKVLDAVLNFGALSGSSQQAYASLISAVLTFSEDQLHVTHAWRLPPSDQRVVCPAREGVLSDVIRTSEVIFLQEPARDPELQHFLGFRACRSLLALPLRAGYETYGVVVYGHPRPDFFDPDARAFLEAVVNQAVIALQNAQLYHKLREEKERLVEVQEEAQKKLARDLHDGPTQSVAALAMRANFVRRLLERDPSTAGDELFKMEDLARRTTKEIRHMLFTLRPLVLENQGLTAALQQLAEKMHETHGQNVLIQAEPGVDERLEKNQQGVLFYIAEEAVGNARKHAQAEHIWVRLKTQRDVLVLEIQDDGVGFNLGAVDNNYDKRGSLGMVNMRERAEILNGAVKIDSTEGKGTRVTVLVPLS